MQANHSPSPDAESIESSRLRSLTRSSRALSEARPEQNSDPFSPTVPMSTEPISSPSPVRESSVMMPESAELNSLTQVSSNLQLNYEQLKITELTHEESNQISVDCNVVDGAKGNTKVLNNHNKTRDIEENITYEDNYHAYRSYRSSRAPSEVPDRGESEPHTRVESARSSRAASEASFGEMSLLSTSEALLQSSPATPRHNSEAVKTVNTSTIETRTKKLHWTNSLHNKKIENTVNDVTGNTMLQKLVNNNTNKSKQVRRALYDVNMTKENALHVRHRLYHTVKHAGPHFDLFQSLHYPFDDDSDDDVDERDIEHDDHLSNHTHEGNDLHNDGRNAASTEDTVGSHNHVEIKQEKQEVEQIEKLQVEESVCKEEKQKINNDTEEQTDANKEEKLMSEVNTPTVTRETDNNNASNNISNKHECEVSALNESANNKSDVELNTNSGTCNLKNEYVNNNPINSKTQKSSANVIGTEYEGSMLELYTMGISTNDHTESPSISAFSMITLPDPVSGAALVGLCVGDTSGYVEYVEMSASELNSQRIRKSRASLTAEWSQRHTSHSLSSATGYHTYRNSEHAARTLRTTTSSNNNTTNNDTSHLCELEESPSHSQLQEQEQENEPLSSLPSHHSPLARYSNEQLAGPTKRSENMHLPDANEENEEGRMTQNSINTNIYCHNNNHHHHEYNNTRNGENSLISDRECSLPIQRNRYSDPFAIMPNSSSMTDTRTTVQTIASQQTALSSTMSQCTLNSRLTLEARGRELVRRHNHRAYIQSINVLTSAAELPSVKCLTFVRQHTSPSTISYLTASEHVMKLFHVRRDGFCPLDVFPSLTSVVGETFRGSRYFARLPLQPSIQPYKEFGPTSDTIQALDTCADGETFMSVEDLQVFWWHFEARDTTHGTCIADCRPVSGLMNDVEELITAASFHPIHSSLYLLTRSSGMINIGDLRDPPSRSQRRYAITSHITPNMNPAQHASYDEILCSISTAAFLGPDHIVTRDYLSLKLWDLRKPELPCEMVPVMDYVVPHLDTLYDNDSIFDRFPIVVDDWSGIVVTGLYDNAIGVWQPLNKSCPTEDVLTHYHVETDERRSNEEYSRESHESTKWLEKKKNNNKMKDKHNDLFSMQKQNAEMEQHFKASIVTSRELQLLLEQRWLNKCKQEKTCDNAHVINDCTTPKAADSSFVNNNNIVVDVDVDEHTETEVCVDKVLNLAIAPGGERFAFPSSNGKRLYIFERTARNA